jgi:predicted HicB family RNase H-like nuclease
MSMNLNKYRDDSQHSPEKLAVITVRMSPELHDRLRRACYDHRISMNSFALAAIEDALNMPEEPKEE